MTTLRNILTILTIGTTVQLFGQNLEKDTTFISKVIVDGELQSIFIDNNKNSKCYDRISHFNFLTFDNRSYKYSSDYLKKQKLILTKAKPIIPWTSGLDRDEYIIPILEQRKKQLGVPINLLDFLRKAIDLNILVNDNNQYSFSHEIYQEYYAAEFLMQLTKSDNG